MEQPTRLPWSQRLSFGAGHVLNDLTATLWFNYLIMYLQVVLKFDSTYAGFILFVGQVADAIATPLLGYEISIVREHNAFRKYGKRKFLHLIGTLCVIASFPFIFIVCLGCENSRELALIIMLVPVVIIFQFGWAATQVSHLSLIPIITPYESERDFLNMLRYAVDTMADVSTFVIVWCVFDLNKTAREEHGNYAREFKIIVLIVVGIGIFFSTVFHVGVKEIQHTSMDSEQNTLTERQKREKETPMEVSWKDWLKEVHFYQIGLLYTFARLFQNMSSVFMPLYLEESLYADDDFIAKIPLLMNVSAFALSLGLPKLFRIFSKKVVFLGGVIMGVGSCLWVAIGHGPEFCNKGIYGVGILMGSSASVLVISSLSFTHDLIGTNVESGAFVYGCMSFCDKLANGIGVMLVQYLHSIICDDCDWFYRNVMSYGVGGTALVASLMLFFLNPAKLRERSSIYSGAVLNSERENGNYKSMDETKPLLGK